MDIDPNLLNEYIQIDYEITQIESKDVLNMYHENVEQIEQIERELNFASREIERLTQRQQQSPMMSAANNRREGSSLRSVSIRHNRSSKRNSSTRINRSDAASISIEEMFAKKVGDVAITSIVTLVSYPSNSFTHNQSLTNNHS